MNKVTRRTEATPAQVWAVLSEGRLYGSWVVGASRIRDVDPDWPHAGARIHHSVGLWPALLDDETVSLQSKAGLLELSAAAWPFGRARIRITVEKESEGSLITMEEFVESAPLRWIPHMVQQAAMAPRLDECLARLAMLAERDTQ
ncbi:SRPBCC family protein [Gordonia sp. SID5947]|uniref:SRPBCC family protein n=1 Tax=Gordonia sp. SID5947 TaxID=2690315 RepID=UPI001370384B|nr:SRPBCC family protein [Gordonia sp. SID5947]MYR08202.1 SRPBCC family protein [Gordonia sp. SID5947]